MFALAVVYAEINKLILLFSEIEMGSITANQKDEYTFKKQIRQNLTRPAFNL